MPISTFRRTVVLLLLVGALAASGVSAAGSKPLRAPHRAEVATPIAQRIFGFVWSALSRVWGEDGCTLDPSGLTGLGTCHQGASATPGDEGCTLDPHGVTVCGNRSALTAVPGDDGCTLDPNGVTVCGNRGALTNVPGDGGCTLDPSGCMK